MRKRVTLGLLLAHPANPALSAVNIIQEPDTDIDPGGLTEQLVSQTR